MTKQSLRGVIIPLTWALLLVLLATGTAAAAPMEHAADGTPACAADVNWITNPSLPTEIPGGGTDFCQFYQYAWQTFLYLGSPSATAGDRNFEVWQDFPILQADGSDSCTSQPTGPQLFVRMVKGDAEDSEFVIPERIGQAGDGATIYDQKGNVVFYDVRFDRALCEAKASGDLPAGTTELKTSWRQVEAGTSGYFTMDAVIEGVNNGQPVTLGLVGFHLFRTTPDHPEGVWMTWEHFANNPDCIGNTPKPAEGWSFTSASCAQCLATSTTGTLGCPTCNFNTAKPSTSLTGTPTEVCRVYPYGTAPADHESEQNVADIVSLNDQLIGPNGLLAKSPAELDMRLWQNYFLVGGLWVSDPSQPASTSNQRGSMQLTNTTMETTFQGDFVASGSGFKRTGAVNCFACHNYTPGKTATTGLSHIFDEIHGSSSDSAAKEGAHDLHFVKASHPPAELRSSHGDED